MPARPDVAAATCMRARLSSCCAAACMRQKSPLSGFWTGLEYRGITQRAQTLCRRLTAASTASSPCCLNPRPTRLGVVINCEPDLDLACNHTPPDRRRGSACACRPATATKEPHVSKCQKSKSLWSRGMNSDVHSYRCCRVARADATKQQRRGRARARTPPPQQEQYARAEQQQSGCVTRARTTGREPTRSNARARQGLQPRLTQH